VALSVLLPYARSGSNTRLSSISRASKFSRLESLQNLILFARFGRFICLPRVQPGLPEEEMFKRLCALNEAEAKECKVCNNSIEAAGR